MPAGSMRRRRPLGPALAAGSVMALTQIAVPLVDERATLTTVVVVAFAATTTALAATVWGWRRSLLGLALVVAATTLVERVGTGTGLPFGDYRYTGALQPTVAGVPLAVVLAWWAMAVPAREVAARLTSSRWARVAVGALALTAWDVMLDPQMVGEGFWTWADGGPWRDVPLSNYAGWLVSSALVMALLEAVLPGPGRSRPLLVLYTWWAVMQTLGFLAFFGDPLVGVVGGLCMGPLTWLAWRRELGPTATGAARTTPLAGARRG